LRSPDSIVILLHHVRQMVMEKLEMIFAIASKLFACASFVITLFNVLSIHVTLSLLTRLNQLNLK